MLKLQVRRRTPQGVYVSDLGTTLEYDAVLYQTLIEVNGVVTSYTLADLIPIQDGRHALRLVVRERSNGSPVSTSKELLLYYSDQAFEQVRKQELRTFYRPELPYRRHVLLLDQARFEVAVGNPVGFTRYLHGDYIQ